MILPNHWLESNSTPLELCRRHAHPAGLDAIQRLPERVGGILRSVQGCVAGFGMGGDAFLELAAPNVGVINISRRMEREIAAGLVISAIHLTEAALFFFRNARYLRLIGIEGRKRLFRRAFAGHSVEVAQQLANLKQGAMPLKITGRAHAFRKVEPE